MRISAPRLPGCPLGCTSLTGVSEVARGSDRARLRYWQRLIAMETLGKQSMFSIFSGLPSPTGRLDWGLPPAGRAMTSVYEKPHCAARPFNFPIPVFSAPSAFAHNPCSMCPPSGTVAITIKYLAFGNIGYPRRTPHPLLVITSCYCVHSSRPTQESVLRFPYLYGQELRRSGTSEKRGFWVHAPFFDIPSLPASRYPLPAGTSKPLAASRCWVVLVPLAASYLFLWPNLSFISDRRKTKGDPTL